LADRDRRVRRPDEPDSQGRLSKQGPAILEAARVAQDKPGTRQPGAESWAQAYVTSGDLVDEVTKLKVQDGKPMFGATFARSLIAHSLVDQFELAIIPIVLGQGLPIFTELTHPRRLTWSARKLSPKAPSYRSIDRLECASVAFRRSESLVSVGRALAASPMFRVPLIARSRAGRRRPRPDARFADQFSAHQRQRVCVNPAEHFCSHP
jgi:hypothetical protein